MSAPTPSILRLPPEILDIVFLSVSCDDLRNLSLASRMILPNAQRVLFHTVRFALSGTSFAYLMSISNNASLRSYVKCLEYTGMDRRDVDVAGFRIGTFANLRLDRAVISDFRSREEREDIKIFHDLRVAFILHNNGDGIGEHLNPANHMKRLLRAPLSNLPSLSSLYFAGGKIEVRDDPIVDPLTWTLLEAFLESSPLRGLKELHLMYQDPADWIKRLPVLQNVFNASKHLKRLTLGFQPDAFTSKEFEFSNTSEALSKLELLRALDISQKVHTLEFDIHFNLACFFKSGQHWEYLESLSLQGVTADYKHLVSMLSTHASSLKSLELISIRLTSLDRDSDSPLSWIELFIFLNENMSLSYFKCAEWLETVDGRLEHLRHEPESGHGEFWRASFCICYKLDRRVPPIRCLRCQIERYITHQGVLPFKVRVAEDEPVLMGRRLLPWTWVQDESFHWDQASYCEVFGIDG